MPPNAAEVVAEIARASRAKFIAYLAARSGDIATAEDAVAEAFRMALEEWPVKGIPQNGEGWLFTVATRRHADLYRKTSRETTADLSQFEKTSVADEESIPDQRLRLFFVCAHPGIDENVRAALMLQTILGIDAERIASAFLVSPAAMAKRLVRAKNKIRLSKIPFVIPEGPELIERISAVLEAIYGAYGLGWQDVAGSDTERIDLADEAIFLARMLTKILPQSAEAWGLLALLLFSASRASARRDSAGRYIPLALQDAKLWNVGFITEADRALRHASTLGEIGPYQLEAAIQAVHAMRGLTGETNWLAIVKLYEGLLQINATVGGRVGFAAALIETDDLARAKGELALVADEAQTYQPYWVVLAEIKRRKKNLIGAAAALRRAVALVSDHAVRSYLLDRLGECEAG